ncbi:MAG TPA: hypothetical protein VKU44_01155 [Terriglobia bacterium]|nr:hypothetical protein [Terriglobia bacterium]
MVGSLAARLRRLEERRHQRRVVFIVRNEEDPLHPDEGQPWCHAFVVRQLDCPAGQAAGAEAGEDREVAG